MGKVRKLKTPHLKNKEINLKEMRRYRSYHTNSKYFRCTVERIGSDCHCFISGIIAYRQVNEILPSKNSKFM